MPSTDFLPAIETTANAAADDAVTASVIWLHGLGASGHDFVPVVPHLRLPETLAVRFVFPHAPAIPVTINGGMVMPAWYDILEATLERKIDHAQIVASAEQVAQLIDRECERGVPSDKIVLAGFSQGGAVAYQTALTYSKPLAGLLALSTYFATADTVQFAVANHALAVSVQHGRQDAMVDIRLAEKAVQELERRGYQPEYKTYDMGHEVCMQQIQEIGLWLQAVLQPATAPSTTS